MTSRGHTAPKCQNNQDIKIFLFFSGVVQSGNEYYLATQQIVRNIVDTKVVTIQSMPICYRPEQILVNHLGEYLVQINGILYPVLT